MPVMQWFIRLQVKTKIQINVVILYLALTIIAGAVGYGIYLQHQLNEANAKLFETQNQVINAEIEQYKKDLINVADSLIKIRTVYKTIEVERNKQNEKISKINDADSIANEFNYFWSSRSRKQ